MHNRPFFSSLPQREWLNTTAIEHRLTNEGTLDTFDAFHTPKNGKNGKESIMDSGIPEITTERPTYDSTKFEARAATLDKIHTRLQKAATRQMTSPLIEIVGVTWIGKTWLLNEIRARYTKERNYKIENRFTCAALFDLETVEQESAAEIDIYAWYTNFLRRFVPILEQASGEASPPALGILAKEDRLPLDPDELNQVLDSLKQWFANLRQRYFPILLLDSTEKVDTPLLAWLEREILVPFVDGNQALAVTAGRQPIKWREPEIRFYYDLIHLGPLEEWGKRKIPKWIHQEYALGHAGLAAKLYEAFDDPRIGLERAKNFAREDTAFQDKIRTLLGEAISKIVLFQVPDRDIPREQMNLQALLWTISVLRIFNPEILQTMVNRFGPETYHGKSYMFFRQAAFNLIGAQIAAWRAGINDYRVEPLIRRIMANAVRIVDGKEQYLERHKTAEEWYRVALERAPSTAPNKLPELLYHVCMQVKVNEPEELSEIALSETRAILDLGISQNDLDTLFQRFTNQDDADLKELRKDMVEVIGDETYQEIVTALGQALRAAELVPAV